MSNIIPFTYPETGTPVRGLEAHVYVIRFENGLIKVGYSANVPKRVRRHQENGAAYGNPVTAQWASTPHIRAAGNERALIAYCARHGQQTQGREWFTGVSFEAVSTFAATLTFDRATPEDVQRYQRTQQVKLDALNAFFGDPSKVRTIVLPHQLDASSFAALPDGADAETMRTLLADLLDVSVAEVSLLPDDAQVRVMAHLAEHWNRKQEVAFLEGLLEEAQERLSVNVTSGMDALRRDIHTVIEGGIR